MAALARFWLALVRQCRRALGFFRRNQAEQAALLRHSEHRYRTLVEQLPIGIYIDEPDDTCTNVYSNPRVIEMLGYPLSKWVGDPNFFATILHPDDRERVLGNIAGALRAGERFQDEYRAIAADGRTVWIWEEGRLVLDENGEPLHVQGVLVDITDRKRAEEQLQVAQQQYRSLVEHLPIVTYIEDAANRGRTLFVSPQMERLLGYPVEDWLGNQDFFFQVLHPDDRDRLREQRAIAEADFTSNVFQLISRDGETVTVRSDRVLVRDDEGSPLFIQGFWLDITEERRLEEQLRQRDRVEAVGRLAGGVAHDFNNLLMAVLAYTELAQQQLPPESPAEAAIKEIAQAASRGGELTKQLLTFSRQQPTTPRAVDLNTSVREAQKLISRLIGETIEVHAQLQPDLPAVHVDPVQLQQIIVNLGVNARDAMPDGGRLEIVTKGDEGSVTLSIADDGFGMDEETRLHAFDPFFTTKPVGEGTGIGLAIVHGIVTQAGGAIELESTPGEGTTVAITLPAAPPSVLLVDEAKPRGNRAGTETIVLIEDEDLVRDALQQALESVGYRVIAPPTPAEAVREAEAGDVDLVITDVTMPGMNGHEVAERLETSKPELPVLLISGYDARPQDNHSARAILQKPFPLAELTNAVRDLLDAA
jgi:two-component system cell cycle sensor histidine kinase/response regulator CckA